jgi:outer membrane receptor protein involved in Fe transport
VKRILVMASAAVVAAAGVAHSQQPPPPPPAEAQPAPEPADEESSADEIVVEASGDQVRIDRRIYTLRDDAAAQANDMFDVLGRIPSVSVSPSGAVSLLGAQGVAIQINGQPVPGGNLEQILRGLPGSDVERIEVITNPSAQHSAQASGGIINIITRQRFDRGFSGTAQMGVDSVGGYHLGIAPSWSRGPWAVSGQIGAFRGVQESDLERVRETFLGGAITTEEGQRSFEFNGWNANRLQLSYRPTQRRRFSVTGNTGTFGNEQESRSEIADASGPLSTRSTNSDFNNENNQLVFEFQQDGPEPRDLLRLNAALSSSVNTSESLFAATPTGGGANQYATRGETETDGVNIKLEVERAHEDGRFLTYGAQFESSDQGILNALLPLAGVTPPAFQAQLDGVQQTLAGYVTYQVATGDWTWLPGLRVEYYRREVVSGGLETDTDDPRVFPSLHIRRELTDNLDLDLSYSSRIERPGFARLDPAIRFFDVNRATSGNPDLEPTTIDAYEANLVYQGRGASYSLTFFDRISDGIVSQFTQLTPSGVVLTMPVNAGTSEQRGLQGQLRGPIGERWRYSLTGNVLNREFDFLSGGVITRRSELEYDGNGQIDWRDPDQNAVGADHLQLDLRFSGPRHGLQDESDAFATANFSWRRRLTQRLFGVFMVQDIFDSTPNVSEVTTADYFERTEYSSPGTRFRLGLTYQFGAGPQRPPQDQPPPMAPMPMQ